ncbi:MAG: glycosyltransferase family 9 protein [Actinobacteria bacterium]|nr:glycosyltransferase family 9 protein [Actinomycetota bacterium]
MTAASQRHRDRGNAGLRWADKTLGVFAVACGGALRRLRGRRAVPTAPASIGLLKASGIGDVVILSGVVADLRAAFPDARLVLFTSANNDAFAQLLDGLDEFVELPVRNPLAAIRRVRAERVDVMVDFGMWSRFEAFVASCSGARCVIGMRTPGQHRHFAFDVVLEHSTEHEIENYRHLVATLGVAGRSLPRITRVDQTERPLAARYVVLHLWPGGSNWKERSWPSSSWHALARALAERGHELVLTGGSGDATATEDLVRPWDEEGIAARSIAGFPPLATAVWLRHADGVVSVNTGVMHLAAALGAPVVALNGPTAARRWGPLGAHVRCVASPVVPDGYLNLGWERDDRYPDCMQAITVDAVLAAWDDLQAEAASA